MDIEITIFDQLCEPFPPQLVHWRVGNTNAKKVQRETKNSNARPTQGTALAYLDARDYADRLDQVVGPENWQDRYVDAGNGATCCEVGIRVDGEWVWKADGAGKTNMEGDKGQFSDAFKRACTRWGIGRYLYDIASPWVDLDEYGRIKKECRPALEDALHQAADRQQWGDRTHRNLYRLLLSMLESNVHAEEEIDAFVETQRGVLKTLPADMKRELWAAMERRRDALKAVAA
jgi:hypothetical protein